MQIVYAPTASPFLTQSACGNISPKITMPIDETISAIVPEVKSSKSIEIEEFTQTLPINNEQRRKLPDFRIGNIFSAYLRSLFDPKKKKKLYI